MRTTIALHQSSSWKRVVVVLLSLLVTPQELFVVHFVNAFWHKPLVGTIGSRKHRTATFIHPVDTTINSRHDQQEDSNLQLKSSTLSYLIKTKETFKLSELQWLQFDLWWQKQQQEQQKQQQQAISNPPQQAMTIQNCTQLLVDRATGSTLILLEIVHNCDGDDSVEAHLEALYSTFPWSCVDWMTRIWVHQRTVDSFLHNIATGNWTTRSSPFALEAVTFTGASGTPTTNRVSIPRLVCAVSQALMPAQAIVVEDDSDNHIRYTLVDAHTKGLFLVSHTNYHDHMDSLGRQRQLFLQTWPGRPFAYSSALNPTVAAALVDVVVSLVPSSSQNKQKQQQVLWDPTCGSGSLLAYTLVAHPSFRVVGWDVNPKCVQGSRENLQYMADAVLASKNHSDDPWRVECCDSTVPSSSSSRSSLGPVAAVVANLPWGRNSIRQQDKQNDVQLMQSIRSYLTAGVPCAFVMRQAPHQSDDDEDIHTKADIFCGYKELGRAFIPPRTLDLPPSAQEKANAQPVATQKRKPTSSDCVVIICETI